MIWSIHARIIINALHYSITVFTVFTVFTVLGGVINLLDIHDYVS